MKNHSNLDSLSMRNKRPEIMDRPDVDVAQHHAALRGLARINWLSASAGILWRPLRKLAHQRHGQMLRVLDIATGGGDVPIRLFHRATRAGLPIEFTGIDVSPTAIAYARQYARSSRASVTFLVQNALETPLPVDYDVIMSSLFMHHLEVEQAVELLRRMTCAARSMILINDLIRSQLGYLLACIGTRLLTTSYIVHADGAQSVKSAFTLPEVLQLAKQAGLRDASVAWRWPFRFLLQWRRTHERAL